MITMKEVKQGFKVVIEPTLEPVVRFYIEKKYCRVFQKSIVEKYESGELEIFSPYYEELERLSKEAIRREDNWEVVDDSEVQYCYYFRGKIQFYFAIELSGTSREKGQLITADYRFTTYTNAGYYKDNIYGGYPPPFTVETNGETFKSEFRGMAQSKKRGWYSRGYQLWITVPIQKKWEGIVRFTFPIRILRERGIIRRR